MSYPSPSPAPEKPKSGGRGRGYQSLPDSVSHQDNDENRIGRRDFNTLQRNRIYDYSSSENSYNPTPESSPERDPIEHRVPTIRGTDASAGRGKGYNDIASSFQPLPDLSRNHFDIQTQSYEDYSGRSSHAKGTSATESSCGGSDNAYTRIQNPLVGLGLVYPDSASTSTRQDSQLGIPRSQVRSSSQGPPARRNGKDIPQDKILGGRAKMYNAQFPSTQISGPAKTHQEHPSSPHPDVPQSCGVGGRGQGHNAGFPHGLLPVRRASFHSDAPTSPPSTHSAVPHQRGLGGRGKGYNAELPHGSPHSSCKSSPSVSEHSSPLLRPTAHSSSSSHTHSSSHHHSSPHGSPHIHSTNRGSSPHDTPSLHTLSRVSSPLGTPNAPSRHSPGHSPHMSNSPSRQPSPTRHGSHHR